MNSTSAFSEYKQGRLSAKEIAMLALMAAIAMAGKVAMASLPNIEPVTLILMCAALIFGWRAMYATVVYIMLEGLVYGFGIWWISYLYIWPILIVATMLLRKTRSYIVLVVLAAVFGLLFGALCAIPYVITGGIEAGIAYWVSGIPFDLLHFAGNLVITGVLLKPLHKLLCRVTKRPLWD